METVMERQMLQQHTVSFGRPVMSPYLIPVLHSTSPSCINVPFTAEGQAYYVTSFSLQGPLGAVITDNVDDLDIALHGQALCTHPLFPLGADIVFVEIKNKDLLKARFYEKETGEAGFSRRGVCAAFVAARILNKTCGSALVAMGGKMCRVEWDGVDGEVKVNQANGVYL